MPFLDITHSALYSYLLALHVPDALEICCCLVYRYAHLHTI